MAISKEEVRYVANLARIKMKENELEKFTLQLDKILEYVNKLNQLDTENVPPTSHIINLKNIMRKDEISGESLSNDEATQMAPDKENEFFRVPKIIE